jgi:hypothetical protein
MEDGRRIESERKWEGQKGRDSQREGEKGWEMEREGEKDKNQAGAERRGTEP